MNSPAWLDRWRGVSSAGDVSNARRLYVLFMMGLVFAMAVLDRNILNILITPIKQEVGASDTAMGVLSGTAFAIFYATAAVPLARMADLGNRRNLLAASLAVWSLATSLCGMAQTYVHLLLARIGVAAGEASSSPAIMSIISDLYPPNRRATAIGVTLIGTGIGIMAGSALGGYFADTLGWRVAFVVVGVPGVFVGLLMWLTIPEPARGALEGGLRDDPDSASVWRTVRYLTRMPSLVYFITAKSTLQIASQGALIWLPTYMIRIHGWTLSKTGLWFGIAVAASTIPAALIGGPLSDRLARRHGPAAYLYFSAAVVSLAVPLALGLVFAQDGAVALCVVFVYMFAFGSANTPSTAAALEMVRPRMRGFMTAIVNLVVNLVGMGLGGLVVGLSNDLLAPRYGDGAIRYSMFMIPITLSLGAVMYLFSARQMNEAVRMARQT